MTDDHLPPDTERAHWVEEEPRRFSARARTISWIAGIVGVLVLIALAVWLSHSSSSSGGGQGGSGRHRGGAGDGAGGGGRGGGGPFSFRSQTTTVGTAKAVAADLPVQTEALGTVTPAATVTVIPQEALSVALVALDRLGEHLELIFVEIRNDEGDLRFCAPVIRRPNRH